MHMIVATPKRPVDAEQALGSTDPVMVRLRLIGQMEAWTLTSQDILPTGRKTRALLAVLALSAPRPVLRGKLAELLWSRRPEEQARASLRQEIHRLLDATDPVGSQILTITRDSLMLRPGAVWVDVEEVLRASPAKPAALSLLDGDLLEDLDGVDPAFDGWLVGERERLRDRARLLAETLLRDKTEPSDVIPCAQQLLLIDRAHEGAWRALMRAYAQQGERGLAIQCYERCRSALSDLLDAQPSEETQRLMAELRVNAPPGRMTAQPQMLSTRSGDSRHQQFSEQGSDLRSDIQANLRMDRTGLGSMQLGGLPPDRPAEAKAEHRTRGGAKVGVVPLLIVGGSDSETHLSTGLAEEITSALARFRWLFLVASGSLARAETRDETAIRRMFNLDFLLDGSIQRAGDRIRISMRLLDLRAGNVVAWSRRFDRETNDLLSLQDEIAAEVVAQIDPEILLIEAQRATTRQQSDATSYDLMLQALPFLSRLDPVEFMKARDLLRQAIAKEPDFAAAHAWYAFSLIIQNGQGWASDPPALMAEAGQAAERAITLDPQDGKALAIAGHVRAFLYRRLREAITLHERALTVNPNLAMAWALSGIAFAYLGDVSEAERRLTRYKTLSPLDPHAFMYDTGLIIVALLLRDHQRAVTIGRNVSEINPAFSAAYRPYLAALGHLGEHHEAQIVLGRLMAIEPDFTIRKFIEGSPFDRLEDRAHYTEGLRRAGVPE